MRMISRHALLAFAALSVTSLLAHAETAAPQRDALFNSDWKFHLGDVADAQSTDLKDTDWRTLNLPHDYSIEGVVGKNPADMQGPFDPNSPSGAGGGSLNSGPAWYRKTFTPPAGSQGKRIAIHFDGVYMDAEFYLNGKLLGKHPYGYTPVEFDITDNLSWAGQNTLAVHTNVQQPSSRWYSGAGIYRNVHLITRDPVHIATDGVWVSTKDLGRDGYAATVQTTVRNDTDEPRKISVRTRVFDAYGNSVAVYKPSYADSKLPVGDAVSQEQEIPAHGEITLTTECRLPSPQLWSLEAPQLYRAETSIATRTRDSYQTGDTVNTHFGLRTIEFTKDNGFLLNGKRVQIQGTCNHHDLGALGSAFNIHAARRQLQLLKDMGCNALRTSHNPPDPQFLDLADEMGFLVMDEAFDEWKSSKTKFGYGRFFDQWSEPDLVAMIHRDRNHPSIILWSIGNEIKEQGPPKVAAAAAEGKPITSTQSYTLGGVMAKRLADIAHREDPTRPVTSACNSAPAAVKSGFADALDVFGVNYYAKNYETQKGRTLLASETASALSTRGEYGLQLNAAGEVEINTRPTQQCTSYDLDKPKWGSTAEESLLALKAAPWVAGEFVWTGFDYIGEPTPYKYPSRSSYFGIIDLAGFPKDRYYIYQSQWTNKPMVHLLPHWNWKGFEGKEIPVQAYTTGDSAELFLNGTSLGRRDFKDNKTLHLEWKVPYAPGTLKVVAYKDGKKLATDQVTTAGDPVKVELLADHNSIKADGDDLSFITVKVEDKDGNLCPNADDELSFQLSGPATLAGLDNGDPINHEQFQHATTHKAFHGLALAILKSTSASGQATLTVSGPNLPPTPITISTTP